MTHGEPHPGNVLRGPDGRYLVDWDTVQVAPPERDLWMLAGDRLDGGLGGGGPDRAGGGFGDDPTFLDGYTRATGRAVSPAGIALYRLWWALADIAVYVGTFRNPHHVTEDTTLAWASLGHSLR